MPTDGLRQVDRLADRIRLHRQADQRPTVVVEGVIDERFIDRVMPGQVSTFLAGTRDEVIRTARQLRDLKLDRVGCVVDRDFDNTVAAAEAEDLPLVPYDDADLEAMLWWSRVLRDVIEEIGSAQKLAEFGGIAALSDRCLDIVRPLQRLRRASALNGWGLAFDELDLRRRINPRTLTLGVQSLCDALWHPGLGVEKSILYEAAEEFPEAYCPATGRPLVRGRDAIAALGAALRHVVGNLSYANAQSEHIAEIMRLRATDAELNGTQWRKRLGGLLGT
jgi:hypothetical protein